MPLSRIRSFVELLANLAVAAAAIVIIWRVVVGSPTTSATPPGGAVVEDVSARNLVMRIDQAARRGSIDADVVLVEFADYECPFCGRHARETFEQIDNAYLQQKNVQYVFRNYPLEIHKHAPLAAQAAECAGAQGNYWEMHRRLFAKQSELPAAVWTSEATQMGLDMAAFEECLAGTMSQKIQSDVADARRLGVTATPTFFVGRLSQNGDVRLVSRINGAQQFEVFEDALNAVLE